MSKKLKLNRLISVFIPVYNGEKYLKECIDIILKQELPSGYGLELLITDSGSTDGSKEIIESFASDIVFDEIPNSEYGHGKTRQRAAERAKGEYIVFLSQDATPTHYRWLINMIEPFYLSPQIGCVFGRQIPRAYAVPTIKREVSSVFNNFGLTESIVVARHTSLVDGKNQSQIDTFFSDVNSAIRKDLIHTVPFRDVKYAEDQALADDMQQAGYFKAYAPQGSVWHSNEYSVRQFRKRKFDEYIGLQDSVDYKLTPSTKSLFLGWIRPTVGDWIFIKHDRDYNKRAKLKFAILSVGYNISHQQAKYDAAKFHKDTKKRAALSYETTWRSKKG